LRETQILRYRSATGEDGREEATEMLEDQCLSVSGRSGITTLLFFKACIVIDFFIVVFIIGLKQRDYVIYDL
jgi:hypothetical protein